MYVVYSGRWRSFIFCCCQFGNSFSFASGENLAACLNLILMIFVYLRWANGREKREICSFGKYVNKIWWLKVMSSDWNIWVDINEQTYVDNAIHMGSTSIMRGINIHFCLQSNRQNDSDQMHFLNRCLFQFFFFVILENWKEKNC